MTAAVKPDYIGATFQIILVTIREERSFSVTLKNFIFLRIYFLISHKSPLLWDPRCQAPWLISLSSRPEMPQFPLSALYFSKRMYYIFLRHRQSVSRVIRETRFQWQQSISWGGRDVSLFILCEHLINKCNQYLDFNALTLSSHKFGDPHPPSYPHPLHPLPTHPGCLSVSSHGLENELEQLFRGLKSDGRLVWINRKMLDFSET